jgi:BirA family transcriptional regulator, biotin operon repressor / biotin---[acetyl-CoA-carboxylase] ligase
MIKNGILEILYKNKGTYISGDELASDLGVSRTEIWDQIHSLKDDGYIIDSSSKLGYRLIKAPNRLLPSELKRNLSTKYMGKEIHYFKEIDSTNDVAKELADEGAEEGTIVIAEIQSRGRGRLGKKWISPSGGVWMTIILRPKISSVNIPQITLVTGVAVAETIKNEYELDVGIKWPNDILIGKRKVCGILIEADSRTDTIDYLVVGIGIDANVDIDQFPPNLRGGATSLKRELNKEISCVELVQRFLENFENIYNEFNEGKFSNILKDWRKYSKTIGSYVEVIKKGKTVKGEAVGVNKQGNLIMELDDGTLRKVISGECIHIKRG